MAGGGGMCLGQPDMQRQKAGLGAGAEQGEEEDQRGRRGGERLSTDGGEGVVALGSGKQTEGEKQGERAEARHQNVDVGGAAAFL